LPHGQTGARDGRHRSPPAAARPPGHHRLNLRGQRDVDIAAGCLGVRAHLMRLLHQLLRRALLETWQVTDQVRVDSEATGGVLAEADLRRDSRRVIEFDVAVARDQSKCAKKA